MIKNFQRIKEDFTCEKCGFFMRGSGFTNHCSRCLWSRHVDVNPGDRKGACRGMMEPFTIEMKCGEYIILHRCTECGFKKKNKASKGDNFDAILKLSNTPVFHWKNGKGI